MIAHIEQRPVSGGVQDEAELVGERRPAARAVRRGLRFVLLDEIFSARGHSKGGVDVFGIAGF